MEGCITAGQLHAPSLGLVCMTCGAWPPCHKVGSLVHAEGDFTRDASGARVGGSTFKRGSISRAVDMPRSSCDHRALSPFGPPDGVRRCSLEGSASRSSLPTTSRSESARSWWCHRSCLLLAAVGGVAITVGADAVASAGEPLGACYPATLTGVEVVHSCKNGARVLLVRAGNDICLRAKCNNIYTQDFSLGSQVVCPNP
jgi:hypothetical protein